MVRTQIYLPENQIEKLKRLAYDEKKSLSEMIRIYIDQGLKFKLRIKTGNSKDKNVGDWLLSLAKEAKRKKIKGPKDLASNIDKYLYGGK